MAQVLTKKLLLIGWDAADWKVINPMLDKGLLPNLSALINGGVIGNLATLDPMYSPMLWTSIATGKRPYKHGVLGFTEVTPDGKAVRPVMSYSRQARAVWNILSQRQYKTHVVGWWPSHPAEPMNGISISNFFQNENKSIFEKWPLPPGAVQPAHRADFYASLRVHPDELSEEHILPFVPDAAKVDQKSDKRLRSIAKITAHAASLHAAFTHIIRTQQWNFAAIYLDAIDHYCHGFMRFHPPRRPHIAKHQYDLYHRVVTGAYRFHDMMLGRLLELAGEDTTFMLISDHGFQPDHLRPKNIPKEPAGPAYEHSPYGIICIKGPHIKKDELIHGASILDITPTILSLFGLPVGEDMDGKVLNSAFEADVEINRISSWEEMTPKEELTFRQGTQPANTDAEANMFDQLVELGYIDKAPKDKATQIKMTQNECDFNLARSYMDGGKLDEAIPVLEKLYKENPQVIRYAFRLATIYQLLNQLDKCRKVIDEIRALELYDGPVLDIIEGSLLIGEKQPLKALKLFKSTESKIRPEQSHFYYQIASCYVMLKRWQDAENAIEKELALDFDNANAHQLLASIYMNTGRQGQAIDCLLTALGLSYHNPQAHILLGRALFHEGQYEKAVDAFETGLHLWPQNNAARETLIHIYQHYVKNEKQQQLHEEKLKEQFKGIITVVSGLPRSGTSMVMQMLEAGGMEIFTDGKREADDNNPKGFYEHELVKSLPRNKRWLPQARNKGVKIVSPLLQHLPANFEYKIIFMERNMHEILASQRKMLTRLGKNTKTDVLPLKMLRSFEENNRKAKKWMTTRPNMEVLYVHHKDVLANPFEQALRINEFLSYKLLPELMAAVVDRSLHREASKPGVKNS